MNTISEWLIEFTATEINLIVFLIAVFVLFCISYSIQNKRQLTSKKIATNLLTLVKEDSDRLIQLLRELGILKSDELDLKSLSHLLKSTKLADLTILAVCFKLIDRGVLSASQVATAILELIEYPSSFNGMYAISIVTNTDLDLELEFRAQIFSSLSIQIDRLFAERQKRLAEKLEQDYLEQAESHLTEIKTETVRLSEKSLGKHTITRVLTAGLWARFRFQQ